MLSLQFFGWQIPPVAAEQTSHRLSHRVLQQTPCAQIPLRQSLSSSHASPSARSYRQTPSSQCAASTQSASLPQVVLQALTPHR